MSDEFSKLICAAREMIQSELSLGGDFLPACRNPLPPAADSPTGRSEERPAAGQKAAALAELEQEAQKCLACQLGTTRSKLVFGEGSADAELVFVGEAPGEEEDRTGRPFVGRAGELLTRMIGAMGLRRQDVYICNIGKCRPPGNRAPAPEEIQACWSFLVRQLQVIGPKVIVTLGNPATQNLLGTSIGITKLRGQWQRLPDIGEGLEGTPVMPTFHPAFVLRQYTPDNRRKVWEDLKKVLELLGRQPPVE